MTRIVLRSRPVTLSFLELEARAVPTFLGNQVFPLDNPWNQVVANAPVAANSAAIIGRIAANHGGTAPRVHPDFGNPATDNALYGIPINVVDSSTPKVQVLVPNFAYPTESDLVPVPIPANAVIEGDGPTGPSDPANPGARGDSHLLVYDRTANVLYEMVSASRPNETSYSYGGTKPLNQWGAWQISVWDLNADSFRTVGKTSADAAGLPIMPGLVRPDEALAPSAGQGVIDHAIRMTVQQTQGSYIFPASHLASSNAATDLPRMGERFRLKASFAIPAAWSPETRAIAQAMKTYGTIVADNGSDMYFQGTPSTQWNMSAVLQIQLLRASDFEVVDLTPVVSSLSATFGSPVGGTPVIVNGKNFSGAAGRLHVFFGNAEASSVTILSDSQVRVVTPAHAVGTVDVNVQSGQTVTNLNGNPEFFGYGTSTTSAADQFTFSTSSPPPPPPPPVSPPPAAVADPILVGGRPDGSAAIFTWNGNGQYAAAGSVAPFGNLAVDLRSAVGDVNGDGIPDLILATGPGTLFQVVVLDGRDRSVLVPGFVPFEGFTAGGFVSAGDFLHTGRSQIVVSPDRAGGPRISIYELVPGSGLVRQANYFSLDPNFRGGVRTAVGDLNGDGWPDLVIAAGYGGGPRTLVIDGHHAIGTDGFNPADRLVGDFFAFDPGYRDGAYPAIGDVNGDGQPDLILAPGDGGPAQVVIVNGNRIVTRGAVFALANPLARFTPSGLGPDGAGLRVAVARTGIGSQVNVVVGAGRNMPGLVKVYPGSSFAVGSTTEPVGGMLLTPFGSEVLTDGVFVG